MKQIHRKRLRKLAEYLLTQVPEEKFDMKLFRLLGDNDHICGTAGCALGWAPAIMRESIFRNFLDEVGCVDFDKISEDYLGIPDSSVLWSYLFSPDWFYADNTPQGAGARILYFLENGIYEGFDYMDDLYSFWPTSHYKKYLKTGA